MSRDHIPSLAEAFEVRWPVTEPIYRELAKKAIIGSEDAQNDEHSDELPDYSGAMLAIARWTGELSRSNESPNIHEDEEDAETLNRN